MVRTIIFCLAVALLFSLSAQDTQDKEKTQKQACKYPPEGKRQLSEHVQPRTA